MGNQKLVIGLAGDVMIGRGVNSVISHQGYPYIWGNLLSTLRNTDLNIANLETTLTNSNHHVFKTFNFKASPDKIRSIIEANITIVNLADNHILDFAEEGLIETLETLDAAGLKYVVLQKGLLFLQLLKCAKTREPLNYSWCSCLRNR